MQDYNSPQGDNPWPQPQSSIDSEPWSSSSNDQNGWSQPNPGQQPYNIGNSPQQSPYAPSQQAYNTPDANYQPMPSPGYPAPQGGGQSTTNGVAIAALVLGLLALLSCWLPFLNVVSIVLGLIGIICGVVGMVKVSREQRSGRGLSIAGIITSVLAVLVAIIMNVGILLLAQGVSDEYNNNTDFRNEIDNITNIAENANVENGELENTLNQFAENLEQNLNELGNQIENSIENENVEAPVNEGTNEVENPPAPDASDNNFNAAKPENANLKIGTAAYIDDIVYRVNEVEDHLTNYDGKETVRVNVTVTNDSSAPYTYRGKYAWYMNEDPISSRQPLRYYSEAVDELSGDELVVMPGETVTGNIYFSEVSDSEYMLYLSPASAERNYKASWVIR